MRTTSETGRTVRRARGQTVRPTTRLPDGQVFPWAALWAWPSPCLCPFCLLRDRHRDVAIVHLEAHCARDALLRGGEIRIERLALRREPHAVIDQLRVA